jgi:hypothetical protein
MLGGSGRGMPGRLMGFRDGCQAPDKRGGFVGPGESRQIVSDGFGYGRQRSLFVSGAPGGEVIPVGRQARRVLTAFEASRNARACGSQAERGFGIAAARAVSGGGAASLPCDAVSGGGLSTRSG